MPGTEFVDEYIYESTFRILITSIFDNLSCKQHRTCCSGRGGMGGSRWRHSFSGGGVVRRKEEVG